MLRQYTVLPEESSRFCESTHFGVFDNSKNRSYSNSMICEGRDLPLNPKVENFVSTLIQKCGMDEYVVRTHFNPLNGIYDGDLQCKYTNLSRQDILAFDILKGVRGDLNFKGTQFTGLYEFFLTQAFDQLEEVQGTIDLSGTNLKNLDIISGLKHVEGSDIFLYNMNELEDISALEHISGEENVTVYFDGDISFTNKLPHNGSFCSSSWSIQTINSVQLTKSLVCEALFSKNDISLLKDIMMEKCYIYNAEEFERYYDAFSGIYSRGIDCMGLAEDDILSFNALKGVNGNLWIALNNTDANNEFLNFNFYGFDNLSFVHGNLEFYGNELCGFADFSSLEKIGGVLNMNYLSVNWVEAFSKLKYIGGDMLLAGNTFYEIGFLNALEYVGGKIDISDNQSLMEIESLSEVKGIEGKTLMIDNKEYETKMSIDSPFCQTGWVVYDESFGSIDISYICE